MSIIRSLLGLEPDPREKLRPLWYRLVEISREPHWYAQDGVEDSVPGRFDMVTAIVALALLRMEGDETLARTSVFLTELFVEDMDGQLRESGVGDLMVGKRMGRLVSVLGGRLGAYREGFASADGAVLADAVARNVTLVADRQPETLAVSLRAFSQELAALPNQALLAGEISR